MRKVRGARKKGSRAADNVDSRKRIVDSALTLFAENGFDGTATQRIADHAGVPTGLVFYYFPSKEHLLAEILSGETWYDAFRRLLETLPERPVLDRFSVLATGMLQWMERNRERSLVFFQEMTSNRKCAGDLQRIRQQLVQHLTSLIEDEMKRGTLRKANASTLSHLLTSDLLVAGIVDRPAHPKRYATDMIHYVLGPLAVPGTHGAVITQSRRSPE